MGVLKKLNLLIWRLKLTVKELRRQGCKVRINHLRYYDRYNGDPINKHTAELLKLGGDFKKVKPRGGITKVEIDFPTGDSVVGEAVCSKEDNYDKKLGIQIALGRALKGTK